MKIISQQMRPFHSKEWYGIRRFRDLLHLRGVSLKSANSIVHEIFHLASRWVQDMGGRETARRLKLIQQSVFEDSRADGWIAVNPVKRKIKRLPFLSKFWKRGDIQLVMSVLNYHREMKAEPRVDVTSIVTPGININDWRIKYGNMFNQVLIEFKNEVEKSKNRILDKKASQFTVLPSLKELALKGKRESSHIPMHFSTKAGPVGRQLKDCALHAQAALQDPVLKDSLLEFSQAMGLKDTPLSFWGSWPSGPGTKIHSKLVGLSDKSCKTRVVAIGDYLSQSLLFPLHKSLMKILSSLREDGTYDQNSAVIQLSKQRTFFGSLDLKNATDRLPVDVQKDMINCLFPGIGDPWLKVMRNRAFHRVGGKPLFYAVGQPMGLLSSWPAMALTHHCIVRLARKIVGRKFDYRVLGDDIVICDNEGSLIYKEIMQDLGVSLSPQTLLSPDRFVFAKKSYINGKSVSPLSWAAAQQLGSHLTVVPVLEHLRSVCGVTPHIHRVLRLFSVKYRKELSIILNSPKHSDLCRNTTLWISKKKYQTIEEKILLDRILRKEVDVPSKIFVEILGLDPRSRPTIDDLKGLKHPLALILGEILLTEKAYGEIRHLYSNGPKDHFSRALAGFRSGLRFFDDPDSIQRIFRNSQERTKHRDRQKGLLTLTVYRHARAQD